MELRDRIVMEATGLFLKFGVKTVTMDEICSNLGVSKKTLYLHFSDKEELLKATVDFHQLEEEALLVEALKGCTNAIDEICTISQLISRKIASMNTAVIYDIKKYYPAIWQHMQHYKQHVILKIIEKNLSKGIAEGLYRPEINVSILTQLKYVEFEIACDDTLFDPLKYALKDVFWELFVHYMYGICSKEGLETFKQYKLTLES